MLVMQCLQILIQFKFSFVFSEHRRKVGIIFRPLQPRQVRIAEIVRTGVITVGCVDWTVQMHLKNDFLLLF